MLQSSKCLQSFSLSEQPGEKRAQKRKNHNRVVVCLSVKTQADPGFRLRPSNTTSPPSRPAKGELLPLAARETEARLSPGQAEAHARLRGLGVHSVTRVGFSQPSLGQAANRRQTPRRRNSSLNIVICFVRPNLSWTGG